jgi:hypothetical protein
MEWHHPTGCCEAQLRIVMLAKRIKQKPLLT